ncbi:5647_t:CDS:1, partial [Scutellospora calospora]
PQMFQTPLISILYNSYQTLPQIPLQPSATQSNLYNFFALPSMAEFLKDVDKKEGTSHYYQDFLENFEKQKILVKHLQRLTDKEFE